MAKSRLDLRKEHEAAESRKTGGGEETKARRKRKAAATTTAPPADTTTTAPATTTTAEAAESSFTIDPAKLFPDPQPGSGEAHGSGCAVDGDTLPDGIWFGFVGVRGRTETGSFRIVHHWFDQPWN